MSVEVSLGESHNWLETLATFANISVGAIGLIVAIVSIIFTKKSIKIQDRHNQLSFLPIPSISVGDYEDVIFVELRNDGVGPAIITKFVCGYQNIEKNDIVSQINLKEIQWSDFTQNIAGKVILPSSSIMLLKMQVPVGGEQTADDLRKLLSEMHIELNYTDVYGNVFPQLDRALDWFGRRFKQ